MQPSFRGYSSKVKTVKSELCSISELDDAVHPFFKLHSPSLSVVLSVRQWADLDSFEVIAQLLKLSIHNNTLPSIPGKRHGQWQCSQKVHSNNSAGQNYDIVQWKDYYVTKSCRFSFVVDNWIPLIKQKPNKKKNSRQILMRFAKSLGDIFRISNEAIKGQVAGVLHPHSNGVFRF